MLRQLPFGRTVIVLLSLAFAALIGIGGASVWLAQRTQADAERVRLADERRDLAVRIYLAVREAEAGQRGFLIADDIQYLQPYGQGRQAARASVRSLVRLVEDDLGRLNRVRSIETLVDRKFAEMDGTLALARSGRKADAYAMVKTNQGRNTTFQIGQELRVLLGGDTQLLSTARSVAEDRIQLLLMISLVGVTLVLGLAVASISLVGRAIAAARSASLELTRSNQRLEQTVADRTEEIRRANDEIQRFAYIVSHDLRSPLVNVMGFTSELETVGRTVARQLGVVREQAPQLLDADAVLAVEEDLPESIGFIRTSTAKMDRLINAILRLSRDGRRVLTPAQTAMTPLVEQIARSLQVMADEAGATVTVEGTLPDLVTDRLTMEQVFSNLIENAVKYLQPGRPGRIVVRGRRVGSRAEYEIEDNGRGVDPKDHARIFELFRRAGVQDKPGEGLGLAFVQNGVRRLGGTIALRSTPGEGSTFTLSFPTVLSTQTAEAA